MEEQKGQLLRIRNKQECGCWERAERREMKKERGDKSNMVEELKKTEQLVSLHCETHPLTSAKLSEKFVAHQFRLYVCF